jgi:hypothetical protein
MVVNSTLPVGSPDSLKLNLSEKTVQNKLMVAGDEYFVDVYLPSKLEYDEMRNYPEKWLVRTNFRDNALVGFILQTTLEGK